MKRELITIENGLVSVPQSGKVRMTAFEIATLFEVYTQTVHTNITAVLKSGVIKADASCPATVAGNALIPDVYGLDMITALAFRIYSPKAEMFREWIIQRLTSRFNPLPPTLFIPLTKGALAN
jgi:hypothetical protein